ncbi:hypothetical protein CDN99_25080 [Roseateles aquatilis]|uniref:Uncharacterized protein n=1 Tax=Roseateles aquatilis TaxID=431061 RepID=A0A246IV98_9BURK|nr:hypothetical protein CDN99_25080 [Roseateles aquatilis]
MRRRHGRLAHQRPQAPLLALLARAAGDTGDQRLLLELPRPLIDGATSALPDLGRRTAGAIVGTRPRRGGALLA